MAHGIYSALDLLPPSFLLDEVRGLLLEGCVYEAVARAKTARRLYGPAWDQAICLLDAMTFEDTAA
jgi:hypothetical protein